MARARERATAHSSAAFAGTTPDLNSCVMPFTWKMHAPPLAWPVSDFCEITNSGLPSARPIAWASVLCSSGFIESQGGGTVLLTRGSIALELGLPVAGVVGFVHSYADGAHTSIPAPGLGALAAGMGGRESKLVRDLAALGVAPDDIAVVSKPSPCHARPG